MFVGREHVLAGYVRLDLKAIENLRVFHREDVRQQRKRLGRRAQPRPTAQTNGRGRGKRYDEPEKAAEFAASKRRSPLTGDVPVHKLLEARSWVDRMPGGKAGRRPPGLARPLKGVAKSGGIQTWSGSSTSTVGGVNGWTSIGPGNIGGRTRGLVVQPDGVLYAAGVAGGVWKSTDSGATWRVLDDFMANLSVCSLVQDPANANVLYAGTGEGYFNGDATRGDGIFKTTDAGATWTQLASTRANASFRYVNRLAVSPQNSQRLYAATRAGVFRSTDSGSTWNLATGASGNFVELAVVRRGSEDLVLAYQNGGTIFRSTNSGATFSASGTGMPSGQTRGSIAASSDGRTIYVALAGPDGELGSDSLVGVYRSTDDGASWVQRADFAATAQGRFNKLLLTNPRDGLDLDGDGFGDCLSLGFYNQGWYDNVIAVDPTNADRVWVGGIDLFRSDDGGVNWSIASYWWRQGESSYVHADQHAIVFDPAYNGTTNQRIYFGNDGGVYRTDNANATPGTPASAAPCASSGSSQIGFVSLNNGYGVTQFYHGAVSSAGEVYIGGTQDNGTNLFDPDSPDNDWNEIYGGDGGYVAVDQTDSQVLFAEYVFLSLVKSFDGGRNFFDATQGISESPGNFLFIAPFAMDPSDSSRLWIGGRMPFRTVDGASSWQDANGGVALMQSGKISAWGIAPSSAGQEVWIGSDRGELFRTTNALASPPTWTNIARAPLPTSTISSNDPPYRGPYISSIAVHPTNSAIAYVTYSNFDLAAQIFRTSDGGNSWASIQGTGAAQLPNLPIHCVAIHPSSPSRLYAGTDMGVFASEDEGATWSTISQPGLANAPVEALVFQAAKKLFAFTHGRGVFVADVDPPPSLNIDSILVSQPSVSVSETILCTVTISNNAPSAVNVVSEHLVIAGNQLSAPDLSLVRSLPSGGTSSFTFTATGVSQGTAIITSATFQASLASTGQTIPIFSNNAAAVPVDVILGTPALSIVSILSAKTVVGVAETFKTTVTVQNDGTSRARVTSGRLVVSSARLTPAPLATDRTLGAGGGTSAFTFDVTGTSVGAASITSATFSAINMQDGSPAGIVSNLAAPAAVSVVNAVAAVKIVSISVPRTTINTGQSLACTVQLRNDGTAGVNLSEARLTLTGTSLSAQPLALAKTLAIGGSLSLDFTLTGTSAGVSNITSVTFTGVNATTGASVGVAANLATSRSVIVQTPAGLAVDAISASASVLSRGQSGVAVQLVLRNKAPSATGAALLDLRSSIRIGANSVGYTVTLRPGVPESLGAGQTAIVSFSVAVLSNAPFGLTTIVPDVRAKDANTLASLAVSGSPKTTWTVRPPARLSVGAPLVSHPVVLLGQSGAIVSVPISNSAPVADGSRALTVTASLRFDGSDTGYRVTSVAGGAASLAAGELTTHRFLVDVLETARRGPVRITAEVSARDEIGGQAVGVDNPSAASWTAVAPGSVTVAFVRSSSERVSRGQGAIVELGIGNPGDLTVTVAASPRWNDSTDGYSTTTASANATGLAAGRSTVLTYAVDVLPSAPLGPAAITARVEARDADTGSAASVMNAARASWRVQTPAALEVLQILAGRKRVVRAMRGTPVEVVVANPGDSETAAAAVRLGGRLLFGGSAAGYVVTTAAGNASTLGAGRSAVLTYLVDATAAAPPGAVTVTAEVTASDANSSAPATISGAPSASWQIVSAAALRVTTVGLPRAVVTRGERALRVDVGLTNTGETTASAVSAALRFNGSADGYFVEPATGGSIARLAPGESGLVRFIVDTLVATPLGPTTVSAAVAAQEELTGDPVVADTVVEAVWRIQEPAVLTITHVKPGRSQVVRGAVAEVVELGIANPGPTEVTDVAATLAFGGTTSGYRVTAAPGNVRLLAAGQSRLLTFFVDVLDLAAAGETSIEATVTATESGSGAVIRVGGRGSWRVIGAASIRVESIVVSPSVVNTGTRGLSVRVGLSNPGQTAARDLGVGLRFEPSGDGFRVTTAPTNASTMAALSSAVATFVLDLPALGPPGPLTVTAAVTAREELTDQPAPVTGAPAAVVVVQRPARLQLSRVDLGRAALAIGETTTCLITLSNVGEAAADVDEVEPRAGDGLVFASVAAIADTRIAGGGAATFAGGLRALSAGGSLVASAVVVATDANSGDAVTLTTASGALFATLQAGPRPVASIAVSGLATVVDGRPAVLQLNAGGSSVGGGGPLSYGWTQTTGPSAELTAGSTAVQRLVLSQPGRYGLSVQVVSSIGLNASTGVFVDVREDRGPSVSVDAVGPQLTGDRVRLRGSAVDPEGDPVTYRWGQLAGPDSLALLGDTTSSTLTVVATSAGDYTLRLTATDPLGGEGAAQTTISFTLSPSIAIQLGAGTNFVSLPLSPFTTDGHPYNSDDLVRDSDGSVLARVALDSSGFTRFGTYMPGVSRPFILQPGVGYVLLAPKPLVLRLRGRKWPSSSTAQILRPNLALLGYPRGVPVAETSRNLLERAAASFLIRTKLESGRTRRELYLPGLSPTFTPRPGEAFFLTIPGKRTIFLPDAPQ
ncbi:MAG: hypothetical protein HY816_03075 [Candidatus Wallbacteria bacterium]|nr:hypothetical protein [Candidatus Wallbacteria bacterium]